MSKDTEVDLLSLVKHHVHESLLLDQLLVVLCQTGVAAVGVAEGAPSNTTGKELVYRAASWQKDHACLFSTRPGTWS